VHHLSLPSPPVTHEGLWSDVHIGAATDIGAVHVHTGRRLNDRSLGNNHLCAGCVAIGLIAIGLIGIRPIAQAIGALVV
jgi:hypothetical protein